MIRLETFPTYVKTARNLKKSETHKDILMTINAKNACIRMFIWSPCVDPHDRRPSYAACHRCARTPISLAVFRTLTTKDRALC